MVEIVPAILSQTKEDFNKKFKSIEPCVKRIHLDIADGIFVPNKTIDGLSEVIASEFNGFWDVHLMVQNPIEVAKKWFAIADVGVIFVHTDTISVKDFVNMVGDGHSLGVEVGIVADVGVNFDVLVEYLYKTDIVQCMTVKSGFYGGDFIESGLTLAKKIHSIFPTKKIAIDGGMNPERAKLALNSGASQIISGGYIMNSDDPCQSFREMQAVVS